MQSNGVLQCPGLADGVASPLYHTLMAWVVHLSAVKKKTPPLQVWFSRWRRGAFISAMQERQDTPLVSMYSVAAAFLLLQTELNILSKLEYIMYIL